MTGSEESATITVRVIKSLQYKNFKNIVFRNVNLHALNLCQLRDMVLEQIRTTPNLKQYETTILDTFKLYYQAHGAKTNNPMINLAGDDQLILNDYERSLFDLGIRHETEVSYFGREDYEKYKSDPTLKW